jgi:hypothetical protein
VKVFAFGLVLVALIPASFGAGYALHRTPAPTLDESIAAHLKPDAGSATEQWVFMPTKGYARGQVGDAVSALGLTPELRKLFGIDAGVFLVRSCATHSSSGDPKELLDSQVVQVCSQREVSRKQVEKHARKTASGSSGRGTPALEG